MSAFGPWYGHRESSIDSFKNSVELLKKLNIAVLAPGHGAIVTNDIGARFDDFCSKIDKRDQRILSLLEGGGRTIDQLVEKAPIYGKFSYAELLLRYWEGNMIRKHLERLIAQGKVIRLDQEYRIR